MTKLSNINLVETRMIDLSLIDGNHGQIPGVKANPRVLRDDKFRKLKKSIQDRPEMMALRELMVFEHDGRFVTIGGNQRLEALRSLKAKEAPCKVIPAATTPDELNAYIVLDNAPFGEWDWDMLANEWNAQDLSDWGVDFPEDWAGGTPTEEEKEAVEDDFDETRDEVPTICKDGDIWQLGNHRLMCGDSTDAGSVALLMDGEKADMCFTDPPYGVSYADKNEFLNSLGTGHRLTKRIENDSNSPSMMHDFWLNVFNIIGEFTADCMAYYITAPQGGELLLLQAIQESDALALKHMLVWNKNNHVLGRCDYNYKHEPIIYGWKKKGTHHFVGGSKFKTSVWDIPKPQKSDLHPTMKPVELVAACLQDNSIEGQSVLDLFGGSGTTLIAAEQLNRKCYMMELDAHYCDIIIARFEKLTGKKALRLTNVGQPTE